MNFYISNNDNGKSNKHNQNNNYEADNTYVIFYFRHDRYFDYCRGCHNSYCNNNHRCDVRIKCYEVCKNMSMLS